jgi:hypothetical protein
MKDLWDGCGHDAMATAVSILSLVIQLTSKLREQNNETETDYGGVKIFSCV